MIELNIETLPLGPIQTNCYIVWPKGESDCWIIDPGGLSGPIEKIIDEKNLTPKMLLITHGHWDHFLGNRCIKQKYPEMILAIHTDDAPVLPDADKNMSLTFIGKSIISPPADKLLNDGDNLTLGSAVFEVVHTPGHCPGSVCYFCSNSEPNVAFVGDLVFAGGGVGRTDLPNCSEKKLQESIRKIFTKFPAETILYPGHGRSTTVKREKQLLANFLNE
jgi:glyoxylase-like metal-dependent hydrolase (beta-lactamase superfamily II)